MMFIQIIGVVLAVIALAATIYRLYSQAMSLMQFVLWGIIWVSLLLTAVFPRYVINMGESLGIDKFLNAMVYLSIIVLLYLVFKLYLKIDRTEKEITALVREMAIEKGLRKK